jgi:hypothetical protein
MTFWLADMGGENQVIVSPVGGEPLLPAEVAKG